MTDIDISNISEGEFDAAFADQLDGAPDGFQKNASAVYSNLIRRRIRESGVQRLVQPFEKVGDERLTYLPDTELPAIVEEMEPDSRGAKTIPFSDTPDTAFYRGDKYIVVFCKITTPMYTKNIDELRTYKANLRQVVADNALRDVHTEEDNRYFTLVDRIVGTENSASTATGLIQNATVAGSISRATYNDIVSDLEDRDLINGVFVVNRRTAKWVNRLDAQDVDDGVSASTLRDGVKGYAGDKLKFFGVPHITSIKRHLFPNDVVYQFADPAFLGKAYMLQDLRMHVEKKLDILRWCAQEKVGVTIANAAAVNRRRFNA